MHKRKNLLLGLLTIILVGTAVFAGDIEVKINNAADAFTIDKSDGSEALRVTADGKVGIGINTPAAKLDIRNNGSWNGGVLLSTSDATKKGEIIYDNFGLRLRSDTNNGQILFGAAKVGIGIGNTAPAAQLDVAGGVKLGTDSDTCDASKEGTQRYNSTIKNMEFCNGVNWAPVGNIIGSEFALNDARSICYSTLPGVVNKSIIMVPLPNNQADLDGVCHSQINSSWHASGVVKSNYYHQNCGGNLNNNSYGGGYTSFATEAQFEGNRGNYTACGPGNSFICCSPQFTN